MTKRTATTDLRATGLGIALASEGRAPDWIELIPAGPVVHGRDGRSWKMTRPQDIVAFFAANKAALPIDMEHSSQKLGDEGLPAPAYGWIEELEARNGAVWGRVEWTDKGRQAVEGREYRYISPAFLYSASTREIARLTCASLVNLPNLYLNALNREDPPMNWTKLLAALGLSETATEDEAVAAVAKLKGDMADAQCKQVSLDKFVPRGDYEAALNRASTAETKLTEAANAARDAEITGLVDAAVADGKITPATKDFYLASCKAEGGIALFKDFVAKAPVSAASKASGLDDKKPGDVDGKLTDDELAVCRSLGLAEKDFLAARG